MAEQPCVIGKTVTVRGTVSGGEDLVVEGRVEGTIALERSLLIEPAATVEADVEVGDLTLRGALRGEVRASGGVTIVAGARFDGTLQAPRVVIEEGATFTGRLEMDLDLPPGVTGP